MKKSTVFKFFAFALMAVMVSSCSKYEEGSKFTLLTKRSRVVNNWKLDKVTAIDDASGTEADITNLFPTTSIELTNSGSAILLQSLGILSNTDTGTWAFNGDKSGLVITNEAGEVNNVEIVKLKRDELKVRSTNNGITTIAEYVTK